MARKLFSPEIGSMIDCWFDDDDDDASDDCSVMSEVSNFELDEEELGNFLDKSDEEVSDLESCSSTDKNELPHLHRRAIVALSLQKKMVMCGMQIAHHPHGHVLAT